MLSQNLYFYAMINTSHRLPFPPQEFIIPFKENVFRFLCPSNPDSVLDSIKEEQYEKDRFLPYWVEHWPSAQVLFPFLLETTIPFDQKVCELGCGLGILSSALTVKKLDVVSIDISPEACMYAFENIVRNQGLPKVLSSDWRSLGIKEHFDLLVASDVLYEERWIEPVIDCVKQLLKAGGKAWIADPCRKHWETFKAAARSCGFCTNVIHKGTANNGKTTIEILELQNITRPE